MAGKLWSEKEEEQLIGAAKNYCTKTEAAEALSKGLGRSVRSVQNKLLTLIREGRAELKTPTAPSGEIEDAPKADPTDERVLNLERKIVVLQDNLRSASAKLKATQRNSALFNQLAADCEELIQPLTPPKPLHVKKSDVETEETVVLHLSDEHMDQVILPDHVGGMERYDLSIAMARAERLIDTVIRFTQFNMKHHRFPRIVVLAYGDHVNGEIHNAKDHSEYRNTLRNVIACGQVHGQMLRDLSSYFEHVQAVYVPGNHGRRTKTKEHNGPLNNWDYLVAEIARAHVKEIENISVMVPDSFDCMLEIENHTFHVKHGDDIKGWNGIPWYGIERATRRLTALFAAQDRAPNYFCLGHFHNASSQQHTTGETFVNGAWLATTPFGYNAFSDAKRPMQLLHGVHHKHGASWRLPVYIRHPEELNGPKRYSVSFADSALDT